MNINDALAKTVEMKASDLHLTVGVPPMMRLNGVLRPFGEERLTVEELERIAHSVLTESQFQTLQKIGEVDTAYIIPSISRFRLNVYRQRGSFCLAFRVLWLQIPTIEALGMPDVMKELALKPRGMVLVTGPTGSGKSTTLAAMINHINNMRNCHVLTLEDPIEYLHRHNKSMVNQREVGTDTLSFKNALRAALREDPDVILVGEMRDYETISIATTAAETGHLVLSTLHTTGAAQTIDRILDVFPPHQQMQIKVQLSSVLEGIISQQLLPTMDGKGMVPALEILVANTAIRNLIREGKSHQISTQIQTNLKMGMKTMDFSLAELVLANRITYDLAMTKCVDPDMLKRYVYN